MADSKITALTAISTVDPTADPLVIVDVSDTSMAASGTTKKSTINQLLGAGGTATLASATITGDLTVRTTGLVVNASGTGVQVSPSAPLCVKTRNSDSVGLRVLQSTGGTSGIQFTDDPVTADWGSILATSANVILRSNSFLQFQTGGATERMRIDTSGNVGIGVTPSAWGNAYKVVQTGQALGVYGRANLGYYGTKFNLYNDNTNDVAVSTNFVGEYRFELLNGSHVWLNKSSAGTAGVNQTLTQAMTLDASGNLLVGVASGGTARLDIRTSASQRIINAFSTAAGDSSTYGVYIAKFANDSTTAQRFIGFTINNDGAGSGQINANGASQAAFGTFSDSRLKENIVSLPSQLANILSLRPVEFDYKDGSGHQIGFVAQEVQEVYSDAVSEQDGFLTVTGWSKTEARLVSAIKELADKVQALEAKLA